MQSSDPGVVLVSFSELTFLTTRHQAPVQLVEMHVAVVVLALTLALVFEFPLLLLLVRISVRSRPALHDLVLLPIDLDIIPPIVSLIVFVCSAI